MFPTYTLYDHVTLLTNIVVQLSDFVRCVAYIDCILVALFVTHVTISD